MSDDNNDAGTCNSANKDTSVRVAVRIRPQISRELIDMCRVCTQVTPDEPQIVLGTDKAFTFDYVFDMTSKQSSIYDKCVHNLIEGALQGYNATILAYGQTGSGKTYTMGTGFERDLPEEQVGIVPRAVRHLFAGINEAQQNNSIQFSVGVQFMELYNEEIYDLLDPMSKGKLFKIQEDPMGGITVANATIKPIQEPQDALRCLQQGALARTTASTNMNEQSSRSHAVFTVLVRRQRVMSAEESDLPEGDLETLTSKFHFVDLAGSERLKRTGATGDRAREGISINSGLLALGNVISALGDKTKKATHIPYRDSKLTRLLQDSLGGNSQTVMIACISPSDRDFMETLNTLKYANRARNIKNRVQLNQDQSSRTIASLRREIANLQFELLEYKQGKRIAGEAGMISDACIENEYLLSQNKKLEARVKAMTETINTLTQKNSELLTKQEMNNLGATDTGDDSVKLIVARYVEEVEQLKAKLIESESMYQSLKKQMTSNPLMKQSSTVFGFNDSKSVIEMAKKELEREREALMARSLPGLDGDEQNDEDESDSESESDKASEIQAELQEVQDGIELKSRLIEQLENSQKRMEILKQQYEEKLTLLNNKIVTAQKERDQIISNMGGKSVGSDHVKKVRDEYEKKISMLQKELRKLQSAQKEHIRKQRELQAQEAQMQTLRNDLSQLKANKVKLMKDLQRETSRHKEEENRKLREIEQLRKETRKQTNLIKTLQAQGTAKDQVLKRKQEEVSLLRKQRGKLSTKAAGRIAPPPSTRTYTPRHAKLKWFNIQRTISKAASNRQAVLELERELERWMKEREALGHDLAVIKRKQKSHPSPELASEEDTINANLDYIQSSIEQLQLSIIQVEENKEFVTEQQVLQSTLENIKSIDEAKFILEKLCSETIQYLCDVGLSQVRLKEREALLNELEQDSNIQQQLLQHVLVSNTSALTTSTTGSGGGGVSNSVYGGVGDTSTDINNLTYLVGDGSIKDSLTSSGLLTTTSNQSNHSSRSPSPNLSESESIRSSKLRKRAAMPSEMLYGDANSSDKNSAMMSSFSSDNSKFNPLTRVPSAPGPLKGFQSSAPLIRQNTFTSPSPMFNRKSYESPVGAGSPRTPRKQKKTPPGVDDPEILMSPPVYRRAISREENNDVFARLGAGQLDPTPGGTVRELNGKTRAYSPFICTHVVEGHQSQVLSLKVLFDLTLLTASVDRTVKLWDLRKGIVYGCLSLHPGPVVSVEYSIEKSLLFSASGAFVRVWDLRESTTKPIKTLCSSGNTMAGTAPLSALQPGESPITAMTIGKSGNLYTAASSDRVRIWDLRKFSCTGKIQGGHQAAVMCLATWDGNGNDMLATGSKDHYIKIFEVPPTGGLVYPTLNLLPPHYDGIQVLLASDQYNDGTMELFSGSRDTCIKRWDLNTGDLKLSINNAHKGWISGMTIYRDMLLTTCRGGVMRLWNAKTCESLTEVKTSNTITGLVANQARFFTASSSGDVHIWKLPDIDSNIPIKPNLNTNNNYRR